jgi:hypothetical protein
MKWAQCSLIWYAGEERARHSSNCHLFQAS